MSTGIAGHGCRVSAGRSSSGTGNILWLMVPQDHHRQSMPNWEADARPLLAAFCMTVGQPTRAATTRSSAPHRCASDCAVVIANIAID